MSKFTRPLVVSPQPDGKFWLVWEAFTYHVGKYPSKEIIKVPRKFRTDFASVPRIFWTLVSPYGKQGKAAVIHDYLYATGYETRKRSDEIFLEAMEVLGVAPWKRTIMYWAVRVGGGSGWNNHARRRKERELPTGGTGTITVIIDDNGGGGAGGNGGTGTVRGTLDE